MALLSKEKNPKNFSFSIDNGGAGAIVRRAIK